MIPSEIANAVLKPAHNLTVEGDASGSRARSAALVKSLISAGKSPTTTVSAVSTAAGATKIAEGAAADRLRTS